MSAPRPGPGQPPRKLLLIRRDNIGDLVLTTPLLAALRAAWPGTFIAVLANAYNAPVLDGNPDVDAVYAYGKAKHGHAPRLLAWWRQWRLFRALRRERFDLVIHANPVPHARNGRLALTLDAPWRLGVREEQDESGAFNLALTPAQVQGRHHAERVLSLLAPLGLPSAPHPARVFPQAALRPPALRAPPPGRLLGLHLSSRKPCNRWPLHHWRELIPALAARGWRCALFWSPGAADDPRHPGDDALARSLAGEFGSVLLPAPTARLEELIAGLDAVEALLCCDGGALHLAAALGKPLVALFGCTDAREWGPWQTPCRVLEGGGDAAAITPATVLHALDALAL
jgi:ADP-heptose:LPS heptosyltransferase